MNWLLGARASWLRRRPVQPEQQFGKLLFHLSKFGMSEQLGDADHQIQRRDLCLLLPEQFAQDATHVVAVNRTFGDFLRHYQTKPRTCGLIGPIVNGKILAGNPFAQTKNG